MKKILVNRPIVVAVIGYIIGILWGLYFKFSIVLFYFPVIVIWMLFKRKNNKVKKLKLLSIKRYFRYVKLIIPKKVIILIIVFSSISNIFFACQDLKYEKLYKEGKISLTGTIYSDKQEKQYNYIYKMKVEKPAKYNATEIYLKINKKQEIELKYGDKITVSGEYQNADGQRNYGGYDAKQNLKINKIYGTIIANDVKKIDKDKVNFINIEIHKLSVKIKEKIYKYVKDEEADILQGILLGDTRKN